MTLVTRISAVALATCFAAALPAWAEPVKLSGAEIKKLFTGNTVHGDWAGKEYWSFFSADGWTTYRAKGGKPDDGRWYASETQYCSTWHAGGATCYDIYKDSDKIIWETPIEKNRYVSELLTGDQVPK